MPAQSVRARSFGGCLVLMLVFLIAPASGRLMAQQCAAPKASDANMPSPPATASATVAGGTIDVCYNSPRMRGRKIMGSLVPWNTVWRTGANPATTLITSVPLKFGDLLVPAGRHTMYTLPNPDKWLLIINKQTGQWGTVYNEGQDLGRVPMTSKPMATPQEDMTISFEHTTPNSTELHVKWEKTDEYVTITKP